MAKYRITTEPNGWIDVEHALTNKKTGTTAYVETYWKYGWVDFELDEGELKELTERDSDDSIEIGSYSEIDHEYTRAASEEITDIENPKADLPSDEEIEEIKEAVMEGGYSALEELGFEHSDSNSYIKGEVTIEEVKD
jgi:hypothetical protein